MSLRQFWASFFYALIFIRCVCWYQACVWRLVLLLIIADVHFLIEIIGHIAQKHMKLFWLAIAWQRSGTLVDGNDSKFFIQKNEVWVTHLVVEQRSRQLMITIIPTCYKLESGTPEDHIVGLFGIQLHCVEFFVE